MKNNQWEIRREDNNGTPEQEPLSILMGDMLHQIDELKSDIEELGGEDKFEELLLSDESLDIIYQAKKDRISNIIFAILGILLSVSASAGVVNALETFQDEATKSSGIRMGTALTIAGAIITMLAGIGIDNAQKKIKNETEGKSIDQV